MHVRILYNSNINKWYLYLLHNIYDVTCDLNVYITCVLYTNKNVIFAF